MRVPAKRPYETSWEQKTFWVFLFGTMLLIAFIGNCTVTWIVLGKEKQTQKHPIHSFIYYIVVVSVVKQHNGYHQCRDVGRQIHCTSTDTVSIRFPSETKCIIGLLLFRKFRAWNLRIFLFSIHIGCLINSHASSHPPSALNNQFEQKENRFVAIYTKNGSTAICDSIYLFLIQFNVQCRERTSLKVKKKKEKTKMKGHQVVAIEHRVVIIHSNDLWTAFIFCFYQFTQDEHYKLSAPHTTQ